MKIGLRHNPRSSRLAFMLAEVLVALAIVLVCFISLYTGVYFAFSVTRFERENLRATQIMLQRMEGIRLYQWDQLTDPTLNPTNFNERYYPGTAGMAANGIIYTGRVDIADVTLSPSASYSANMKKVTVTVSWTSGAVPRSRSVSTYVAQQGIQNYVYWSPEH